jgi:hypothetical protein
MCGGGCVGERAAHGLPGADDDANDGGRGHGHQFQHFAADILLLRSAARKQEKMSEQLQTAFFLMK